MRERKAVYLVFVLLPRSWFLITPLVYLASVLDAECHQRREAPPGGLRRVAIGGRSWPDCAVRGWGVHELFELRARHQLK